MSVLSTLLDTYRSASVTEREKGTYFEELMCTYLRNEATYRDLYDQVWPWANWAKEQGVDGRDTGIDLVAWVDGTGEYHAIQCKLYAEDYRVQEKAVQILHVLMQASRWVMSVVRRFLISRQPSFSAGFCRVRSSRWVA